MAGLGGFGVPAGSFDRWVNIGVLGAIAASAAAAALHAGDSPWLAYQEAVTSNPIETKVREKGNFVLLTIAAATTLKKL